MVADPASLSDRQYADLLAFRVALRRLLTGASGGAEAEGLPPRAPTTVSDARHAEPQGPTVSDVAGYLLVRHHSAVGLIDRAEAMGLVARRADADDHRVVRMRLTARGGRRLDALTTNHLEEIRRVRPALHALLGKGPA